MFSRTRFEGRCQLAHHQMVWSEVECMSDFIPANRKPRNWICWAGFRRRQEAVLTPAYSSGFISPSIVGISSETVGWICMVRCSLL
jgi:hypothetical protein